MNNHNYLKQLVYGVSRKETPNPDPLIARYYQGVTHAMIAMAMDSGLSHSDAVTLVRKMLPDDYHPALVHIDLRTPNDVLEVASLVISIDPRDLAEVACAFVKNNATFAQLRSAVRHYRERLDWNE